MCLITKVLMTESGQSLSSHERMLIMRLFLSFFRRWCLSSESIEHRKAIRRWIILTILFQVNKHAREKLVSGERIRPPEASMNEKINFDVWKRSCVLPKTYQAICLVFRDETFLHSISVALVNEVFSIAPVLFTHTSARKEIQGNQVNNWLHHKSVLRSES